MNPRHRRLLIPGLLIALLVIVVISALDRRADAADAGGDPVSRIADPRITESSGLVLRPDDPDVAYTVNDSGNAPVLFAVRVSTGATVGATTLGVDLVDAEALSVDPDGTVWVADTGDNRGRRDDVALYALVPPAPGDTTVDDVPRYPLTYPDGPHDVEALAINPRTGGMFLLTKGLLGGEVYQLPEDLRTDRPNRVEVVGATIPGAITDAAFTPDGRYVVARDYSGAHVLDASTWKEVAAVDLPAVEQGETLAMEPRGTSFLVGSEGERSPLLRVPFTEPEAAPVETPPVPGTPSAGSTTPPPGGNGFAGAQWFWSALVVGLLAAISVAMSRR